MPIVFTGSPEGVDQSSNDSKEGDECGGTDRRRRRRRRRRQWSGEVLRYCVEGIVDPAQGLALEFDKALDEEAVDTRHLLHQLNALVDEAAVTSHLLGQPNNVLDDEAAVTSHLLD